MGHIVAAAMARHVWWRHRRLLLGFRVTVGFWGFCFLWVSIWFWGGLVIAVAVWKKDIDGGRGLGL